MPYDWLFELEEQFIRLLPAYTLEMLDNCDIERILPYYFFHYRKAKKAQMTAVEQGGAPTQSDDEDIVIRDGKKYRKVKAGQVSWANQIF